MPEINSYLDLKSQIENEISQYFDSQVSISEDNFFSQPKLIRRISLFESHTYPTGKFDSMGNYKYWYDIQTMRVNAEVKNIDFDRKNIEVNSPRNVDALPLLVINLKLKEWLKETNQGEEINSAVEEGSGWGNVVWKKIKGGYERCDLKNFYVINQTAKSLNESAVIERHEFSQSDLRAKQGTYKYVKEVMDGCKSNTQSLTAETQSNNTTTPFYDIYERNGEVCLAALKEENGETPNEGDDNKYVLAKVIAAGVKGEGTSVKIKYIMYADQLNGKMSDIYKEYHRGRYKGRWWREGLIELLFDVQVRINQIGNQIAQGLEWASKTVFTSEEKLIIQNIMSDLANGDVIRAKGLKQLDVRMEGFDQLKNEWNSLLQLANDIANSQEIVQGITPASGTPLGTSKLVNQNSNKLFDFIREKIAIPFSQMFESWIVREQIKDLKTQDVLRLTGDADMLNRLYEHIVNVWYVKNLVAIGPHDPQIAETLKKSKLDELKKRPQLLMKRTQELFEDIKPFVTIDITGENLNLDSELQSLAEFIGMEADPVRRTALIEMAMKKKGIDVAGLPKTPPAQPVAEETKAARIPTMVGSPSK